MTHPLDDGQYLLGLGTVGEIQTRNRWHEDPNMKGVLRIDGTLPHLWADGDVRMRWSECRRYIRRTHCSRLSTRLTVSPVGLWG